VADADLSTAGFAGVCGVGGELYGEHDGVSRGIVLAGRGRAVRAGGAEVMVAGCWLLVACCWL
jgi:hypothetical protein